MIILVTGANGQVGSEFIMQECRTKHSIVALNRRQLDITDLASVESAVQEHHPDIVVNTAAYTAVDSAEDNSKMAYSVNVDGAYNLAYVCKNYDIPIIHLSTDYIFDGEKPSPYVEEDLANPLNIYGKSKWKGELAIISETKKYIILRTSWVFGVHGNNFVKTILRLSTERDSIQVVNDQYGAPTSADGISRVLIKICDYYASKKSLPWGIYNYTGWPSTSWYEFSKEIILQAKEIGVIGSNFTINPITTLEYPLNARRPLRTILSNKKIINTFDIYPDDWKESLKKVLHRSRQQ
jgi:dTDP-4-dehydrorhamnose reductase